MLTKGRKVYAHDPGLYTCGGRRVRMLGCVFVCVTVDRHRSKLLMEEELRRIAKDIARDFGENIYIQHNPRLFNGGRLCKVE